MDNWKRAAEKTGARVKALEDYLTELADAFRKSADDLLALPGTVAAPTNQGLASTFNAKANEIDEVLMKLLPGWGKVLAAQAEEQPTKPAAVIHERTETGTPREVLLPAPKKVAERKDAAEAQSACADMIRTCADLLREVADCLAQSDAAPPHEDRPGAREGVPVAVPAVGHGTAPVCECKYGPHLLGAWVPAPPGWTCNRCGGFIPRNVVIGSKET